MLSTFDDMGNDHAQSIENSDANEDTGIQINICFVF